MVVGTTYHVIITCPALSQNVLYYINNVVTGASTGVNISASTSTNFFYSTYHTAGDLSAAGTAMHLARFYQGAQLTPGEVKRLYEKPFEMFRKPRRVFGSNVSGSPDITLALTGIAATSAAGSLSTASLITLALSGISTTASPGTVSPGLSKALSGIAATASPGSLSTASLVTIGLTGIAATATPGSVSTTGDKTIAITGLGATAFAGSLAVGLSKALTGSAATSAPGSLANTSLITIGLAGSQAACASGLITATGGTPVGPVLTYSGYPVRNHVLHSNGVRVRSLASTSYRERALKGSPTPARKLHS